MFREADLSQDESKPQIHSAYFWNLGKEGNHFDQLIGPGGATPAPRYLSQASKSQFKPHQWAICRERSVFCCKK